MGCIPSAGRKRLSSLSACTPGMTSTTCSRSSGSCQRKGCKWSRSTGGLDQFAQIETPAAHVGGADSHMKVIEIRDKFGVEFLAVAERPEAVSGPEGILLKMEALYV